MVRSLGAIIRVILWDLIPERGLPRWQDLPQFDAIEPNTIKESEVI